MYLNFFFNVCVVGTILMHRLNRERNITVFITFRSIPTASSYTPGLARNSMSATLGSLSHCRGSIVSRVLRSTKTLEKPLSSVISASQSLPCHQLFRPGVPICRFPLRFYCFLDHQGQSAGL